MLSDSFPVKEVDNVVYEVECKNVVCGPISVNIGANPSTGEGEAGDDDSAAPEAIDDGAETKIDVVDAFRLEETSFDKKGFMTYLKGYIKTLRSKVEEKDASRVASFETAAQAYAKKIFANFDNYRFFQGESMEPEAMVCLLESRDDKMFMIYWKDGVKLTKF